MSTSTGPGRPERAISNARWTASAMSSGRRTRKPCFVTGIVMPSVSHSWNASVPMSVLGTCPVIATIGTPSHSDVASPVTRFAAPGPLVATQTPTSPEARA
jgi:hypothetical protein